MVPKGGGFVVIVYNSLPTSHKMKLPGNKTMSVFASKCEIAATYMYTIFTEFIELLSKFAYRKP